VPASATRRAASARGQRARIGTTDAHAARPVVHQRADGVEVALGRQLAVDQHQHIRAHALDLIIEDVRRYEHGLAVRA